MDITSDHGNNSWKFHDDTMMGTWWKRCDRQTDGRTDGQTDGLNQSYSCLVAAEKAVINSLRPKQNRRYSRTSSNAFSWMKMKECRLVFHRSLFLSFELTTFQHWFREWLGRPGDKSLSEPMMVSLLTHICATRPQWVKVGPVFYIQTKTGYMYCALYQCCVDLYCLLYIAITEFT